MDITQNQKHTLETLYYAISRMLEGASYYGFRALVILYMVGEALKMDATEALDVYAWFTGSVMISQIIGGVFGDLLIGNRKAVIFGGIIQAIGAFSLCIFSTTGLYIGLFLVSIGSGLFTPNIISNFGKSYLNKTKLLDSGFTIFYLAINLGSFFGILLIGYLGETFGYNIGFIMSGILMLLSIVPIIILKEKTQIKLEKNRKSIGKRILNISIAFLVVAVFWGTYEISHIRISDLQLNFSEISAFDISKSMWQSISSILTLTISLAAIVLWTYFYSSQFFKLLLGCIFGVISLGILFLIPEIPTEQHTITYLVSLFFLGISEIHIAPIIHSILTKYSNPKYLAILISLAFLPTSLIYLLFGLFNDRIFDNPNLGLIIGIVVFIIVGIGLVVYIGWNKKSSSNTATNSNPQ